MHAQTAQKVLARLMVAATLAITGCAPASEHPRAQTSSSVTGSPIMGSATSPTPRAPISVPGSVTPQPAPVDPSRPAGHPTLASGAGSTAGNCLLGTQTVCSTEPTLPPGGLPAPAPPAQTPTATISVGRPLGYADNGALVIVKVGQHVDVLLQPLDARTNWLPTTLTGTSLSTTTTSGGYPSDNPLHATFTATAAGTATITTWTDMACFHATPPCLPPVYKWSATIQITS